MSSFLPENDGIDHINIYSKGQTELGRLLSNFAHTPFTMKWLGDFESVEGFWYYMLSHPLADAEHLRTLHGFSAKKAGKELPLVVMSEALEEQFRDYIRQAFEAKVYQNEKVYELLRESTLPFTHYYVFNGEKKEAGYEWQMEFWEELRKEVKKWEE